MSPCKRTPPKPITRERFLEGLNVLPPVRWCDHGSSESFRLSEELRYCPHGSIVLIFCRVVEDYFEFEDHADLTHHQIVALCRQALTLTN